MITNLIFLCTAGFIAAFVDSIAGGGGLISLPAFMLSGMPPHLALGTNKFSSSCASFTSSLKFALSGNVDFKLLKFIAPFTFIGAAVGTSVVLKINSAYLNSIVLVLLVFVSIYSLISKNIGNVDNFSGLTRKSIILGMCFAGILGFYDGFIGPGTGSFLIFGLIYIYKFDFLRSAGNAKVLNFISNITSLVIFVFNGQIDYKLGIPVALSMVVGARFGTKIAILRGSKIIKPIFVSISLCLAAKMLYSVIH
jgi:hypothetical protein